MSGDLNADVIASLNEAGRSLEVFNAGMSAFQADVVRGRWDEAETERANAHDALDKYLDAFGAAHKRLEHARMTGS